MCSSKTNNVDAALRVLQLEIRVCVKEWEEKETVSTRLYLKIGHFMLLACSEKELDNEVLIESIEGAGHDCLGCESLIG